MDSAHQKVSAENPCFVGIQFPNTLTTHYPISDSPCLPLAGIEKLTGIMGELFKPLRRKIGVLTLVMACVCLTEYVSSLWWENSYTVLSNQLFSSRGKLVLIHSSGVPSQWIAFEPGQPFGQAIGDYAIDLDFTRSTIGYRRQTFDLQADAAKRAPKPTTFTVYWFSHLMFVIPLTLLSAWLLLSRLRVAKSVQPVAENDP